MRGHGSEKDVVPVFLELMVWEQGSKSLVIWRDATGAKILGAGRDQSPPRPTQAWGREETEQCHTAPGGALGGGAGRDQPLPFSQHPTASLWLSLLSSDQEPCAKRGAAGACEEAWCRHPGAGRPHLSSPAIRDPKKENSSWKQSNRRNRSKWP